MCFASHLPARPRRTAGRTMRRLFFALLPLHCCMRRVPRVPRAQSHTRRKHGRESLQPLVNNEVRQGACFARLALLRVARRLAARRPRSGPAPGACGCAVAGLCGISAAHHGLSSEQDPRATTCMYCARKCEITYTILTDERRTVCSTRQYMIMWGLDSGLVRIEIRAWDRASPATSDDRSETDQSSSA